MSGQSLPPPATVNLSEMGRHSFQKKVKDTCLRCKGKGDTMGLVCALCNGSGLDEAGMKEMLTENSASAKSNPVIAGKGMAAVGYPGSDSPIHPAITPVVATGAGGGKACCVLS